MIRLTLGNKTEWDHIQAEYLARLIRSKAINFGCQELKVYIQEHFPFVNTEEIIIPDAESSQDIKHTNERFFLGDHLGVYHFLYPNDKLDVDKLVWLLIGIPPAGQFQTIRESLERIIQEVESKQTVLISEERLKTISGYYLRFDRLRLVLQDSKSGDKEDTSYWLQRQLKIRTCPYCNANYTRVSVKGRFRADLEHFFPKSRYPYLSVTLYNLFPSCQTCNKLKSDYANIVGAYDPFGKWPHKSEILYPYDESFDEASNDRTVFRVIPNEVTNPADVFRGESDRFVISLIPTSKKDSAAIKASAMPSGADKRWNEKLQESVYWNRTLCSIRLFALEEVYRFHKPEIQKLIKNYYVFNREGILERARLLPLGSGNIDIAKENNRATIEQLSRDMLLFADLGQEQWGNMPLNKLKADLLEQLDELKTTIDTNIEDIGKEGAEYESRSVSTREGHDARADTVASGGAAEQQACPI